MPRWNQVSTITYRVSWWFRSLETIWKVPGWRKEKTELLENINGVLMTTYIFPGYFPNFFWVSTSSHERICWREIIRLSGINWDQSCGHKWEPNGRKIRCCNVHLRKITHALPEKGSPWNRAENKRIGRDKRRSKWRQSTATKCNRYWWHRSRRWTQRLNYDGLHYAGAHNIMGHGAGHRRE